MFLFWCKKFSNRFWFLKVIDAQIADFGFRCNWLRISFLKNHVLVFGFRTILCFVVVFLKFGKIDSEFWNPAELDFRYRFEKTQLLENNVSLWVSENFNRCWISEMIHFQTADFGFRSNWLRVSHLENHVSGFDFRIPVLIWSSF